VGVVPHVPPAGLRSQHAALKVALSAVSVNVAVIAAVGVWTHVGAGPVAERDFDVWLVPHKVYMSDALRPPHMRGFFSQHLSSQSLFEVHARVPRTPALALYATAVRRRLTLHVTWLHVAVTFFLQQLVF